MENNYLFSKLGNWTFKVLTRHTQIAHRDKLLVQLGITTFYILIPKLFFLLLLANWFKIVVPVVIFIGTVLLVRFFAYGRHLQSDWWCTVITLVVGLMVPKLVVMTAGLSLVIRLVATMILGAAIVCFAPADTRKHPITNKQLRQRLKFGTGVTIIGILMTQWLLTNQLGSIVLAALLMVFLLVMPLKRRRS